MSCTDQWPMVACTPVELGRLRAAYKEGGARGKPVGRVIGQADMAIKRTIPFPPEGGQHNQWYQCDKCQIALQTVDDTHHQCPKCNEVYTGYPYDNVIFARQFHSLTRDMNRCAWAYAVTRKRAYAEKARVILIEFAKRYSTYPLHSANQGTREDRLSKSSGHVFEQTLTEASWTQDIVETYDLIREGDVLSSEDDRSIQIFLRALADNIWKHKAGKSNWQTYHNSAFILIGGVLGDETLIKRAIEDPKNGHEYQMAVSVLPGGMWYENSWSYHFYTLGAVERIIETGRRLGLNLYDDPRVKSMYTVAMGYIMADGTLPRFGDALTTGPQGRRYETAYHYWKDPAFLSILPEGPTWDSIMLGRDEKLREGTVVETKSQLKEGAGHAILRAVGSDGSSSAVLTFGPFGGFHGHFDKLSFVYFALGQELGYDSGRAKSQAYRLPIHKNWYRATTSHNTVLVDRTSQKGAEGVGEFFFHNHELAVSVARVDSAYEGVEHRRVIVLRPHFVVVADALSDSAGNEHTFDWLYHNPGQEIVSENAVASGNVPEGQGFEFIEDARTGTAEGTVRVTISLSSDDVDVVVDGQPGSDVLIGTGVGESVLDRIPMLMVTRSGSRARFGAVIEPRKDRRVSRIDRIVIQEDGGAMVVTVMLLDGAREVFDFDPDGGGREVEGELVSESFAAVRVSGGGERVRLY
ncbi:MAG: heparinase II/III family protein [Candidatus Latescibacterota bacterium]|nr:heparinase II/III family protein [Candidatus Latescibacterota bacterium]